MSGRLILQELKVGWKTGNKFPVTKRSGPVSKSNGQILDYGDLTTIESLRKKNGYYKPNKALPKSAEGQRSLLRARSQLRGTNSIAQVYQSTFRIFSAQSKVYSCDFFRLLYFPPEHFLSLFRKSKPAVNVRSVGEVYLNGNYPLSTRDASTASNSRKETHSLQKPKIQEIGNIRQLQAMLGNDGSNIPRNYAYLRRSLRAFVNKCFIKKWLELQGAVAVKEQIGQDDTRASSTTCNYLDPKGRSRVGIAKDGFYLFQVLKFPDSTTETEFERHVARSVQAVANLDWDQYTLGKAKAKNWVQEANDRVRLPILNSYLAHDQVPRILRKVKS
ncbi:LADA_0D11034g1_1 [Lachancea dasiensis]|uniref:LADA_0D11034g1_1 n=1 Tax=Lachancea dasiensis TaxID=1072105 RepID=A0A1G4J830_9SACH|nr:LADA_0D11034g1_1 [Lachancea dasiensis]